MSSKSDDDQQFTIEKFRSTYTDITVKDCSPVSMPSIPITTSVSVTTTATPPPSNKAPSHPLSIVTCSGNQKIETTHSELKQVAENRLPPYTNVNVGQNPVRTNKSTTRPAPKTSPKVCEKQFATVISEAAILTPVPANNKVGKANVSLNLLPRTEKLSQISITQNKQVSGEKTVSGNAVAEDRNSNSPIHKNIQDQITQLQSNVSCEAIEKNIQTKVLTVTPCTTASKTATSLSVAISVSAKETNSPGTPSAPPSPLSSIPLAKNNSSPKDQFKPYQKTPASGRPNEGSAKNGPPKVISANNVSKPTIITTSDLVKGKYAKSRSAVSPSDTVWSPKTDSEVATLTPVRQILPAISRCTPKVTATVSRAVTPQVAPPAPQISQGTQVSTGSVQPVSIQTVVTALPTNNRCLFPLSSLSKIDSNRELLDALNEGSNVTVTENLTISKQISTVVPAVIAPSEAKFRNVSCETTIQSISSKQSSNQNLTAEIPRKAVNVTEADSGSVDQSPPHEVNISSSPSSIDAGLSKQDVSTTVLNTSEESDPQPKQDEPECLTISSDDEPDDNDHMLSLSDNSDVTVSIMNKEPLIEKGEISGNRLQIVDGSVCEEEEDSALDVTSGDGYIDLICRTVRIGSYKVTPQCPVVLSEYGLRIVIPTADMDSENIVLKIPIQDIRKVLIHFGKSLPVIFYYVSAQIGTKVRMMLNMTDGSDAYFNPVGDDESQKRITLLPEKFSDYNRLEIKALYGRRDILAELNHKEANELLVRSAPREVRRRVQRVMKQVPPNPVQTIMVFPPPPAKGGISINTEDYSCLAEDVFLNDVIIDFYLKYLYLTKLSDEDRAKTHIFSSFFYKRLTDKATPIPRHLQNSKSADGGITAAEIRHSRVRNWTKNIDLFSKDYIVIPLNENQHWFLAIICFPGLAGPVRFADDEPIHVEPKKTSEATSDSASASESGSQMITIGSTTITPLRNEVPTSTSMYSAMDEDNDMEDRDEADGTDEDINVNTTSSEDTEDEFPTTDAESSQPRPNRSKPGREPIKQPCILIFDSLAGASRARIIATLRDYLRVEYKVKHGEDRDFSKNVVRGAVPKVPQQDNFTDCGLFVLQYVETFFEKKIEDYHLPIKALRSWFSPDLVSRKRRLIQLLLLQLMQEQNIDIESLRLPNLHLSSEPSDDSDYDEYGEYYDEDEEEYYERYEVGMVNSPGGHAAYPIAYTEDSDEGEYLDDEMELRGGRYEMFDSDEEEIGVHDTEADSDEENSEDDLMYKDLEGDSAKTKKFRRALHRRMAKMESAEDQDVDDDEEEEEPEEHQLTAEVEERIGNSGLNRDSVSICRLTSAVSRGSQQPSTGETRTTTTTPSALAELKAARPFAQMDGSNDGCSSKKKFKPN